MFCTLFVNSTQFSSNLNYCLQTLSVWMSEKFVVGKGLNTENPRKFLYLELQMDTVCHTYFVSICMMTRKSKLSYFNILLNNSDLKRFMLIVQVIFVASITQREEIYIKFKYIYTTKCGCINYFKVEKLHLNYAFHCHLNPLP